MKHFERDSEFPRRDLNELVWAGCVKLGAKRVSQSTIWPSEKNHESILTVYEAVVSYLQIQVLSL